MTKKWWKNYKLVEIVWKGVHGYGVRRGRLLHEYHNFQHSTDMWLLPEDAWFGGCITTKDCAEQFIKNQGRKEIVVSIKVVKND